MKKIIPNREYTRIDGKVYLSVACVIKMLEFFEVPEKNIEMITREANRD